MYGEKKCQWWDFLTHGSFMPETMIRVRVTKENMSLVKFYEMLEALKVFLGKRRILIEFEGIFCYEFWGFHGCLKIWWSFGANWVEWKKNSEKLCGKVSGNGHSLNSWLYYFVSFLFSFFFSISSCCVVVFCPSFYDFLLLSFSSVSCS